MSSSYYNFDFQTIIISSLWNHIVLYDVCMIQARLSPTDGNGWISEPLDYQARSNQHYHPAQTHLASNLTHLKRIWTWTKKFPKPSKLLHTHTHIHTHTHQQAMSVWMGHFSKWGIPYIYIIIYVIGAFCGTWTKWKFRKCFFWGHSVLYVQDLLSLWPFSYGFFASRLQYKVLIMIFLLILFFRLQ